MSETKTSEKNPLCACGCGREVIRPNARYFGMGHDSKHKARLVKAILDGTTAQRNKALTEVEGLSDRLRKQVLDTVELRRGRVTEKQERARARTQAKLDAQEAKAKAEAPAPEPKAEIAKATAPKPKSRRTRKASA